MTLGGLALAVGMLVDDATVEIENTNRNLDQGKEIKQAILDGASQIAVPALVSTLSICIVFLPMFFLSGVARYLFVPLAEAVVFAMLASYFLSRTLVPTMALYLLKPKDHHAATSRNPFIRFQDSFERGFERLRLGYQRLLTTLVHRRFLFVPVFLLLCLSAWALVPWLGENFFLTPTAASLASTCVPRPVRALKRLHALPISLKTRSAGSFQPRNWTIFSTTSGCPTALLITCTTPPA